MVFLYTLSWAVSDMAIYFIESKYKEIFKLKQMLEKEKIPFDFTCESYPESNFIHYHLEYPSKFDMDGSRIVSVVEGIGSYGREVDKLEIMGLLTPEEAERDSVAGWLTADDVFRRIKAVSYTHLLMGDLPKIELFARQQVEGWDCWGNEV